LSTVTGDFFSRVKKKNKMNRSLRSKCFRRVFHTFKVFFAFWRREHWGECNTDLRSPQFLRVQKAENASNLRKAQRKRLLRRLNELFSKVPKTDGKEEENRRTVNERIEKTRKE